MEDRLGLHIFVIFFSSWDYLSVNIYKFGSLFPTLAARIRVKVCKKYYCDPKQIFLEKYKYGYKKRRILSWFQIRGCRLSEMPLTKVKRTKPWKNAQKRKYLKKYSFLAVAFFRGICFSRHEFEINIIFCVFWLPILIFSRKNFDNLKCNCEKTVHF